MRQNNNGDDDEDDEDDDKPSCCGEKEPNKQFYYSHRFQSKLVIDTRLFVWWIVNLMLNIKARVS